MYSILGTTTLSTISPTTPVPQTPTPNPTKQPIKTLIPTTPKLTKPPVTTLKPTTPKPTTKPPMTTLKPTTPKPITQPPVATLQPTTQRPTQVPATTTSPMTQKPTPASLTNVPPVTPKPSNQTGSLGSPPIGDANRLQFCSLIFLLCILFQNIIMPWSWSWYVFNNTLAKAPNEKYKGRTKRNFVFPCFLCNTYFHFNWVLILWLRVVIRRFDFRIYYYPSRNTWCSDNSLQRQMTSVGVLWKNPTTLEPEREKIIKARES